MFYFHFMFVRKILNHRNFTWAKIKVTLKRASSGKKIACDECYLHAKHALLLP